MNISGREYSKSTVGLRQPKNIKDQQFKLVFIYPMLVDTKLSKYTDLLRSYISTNMLKEIYTSNALNILSMASNISPLIDEKGNIVDVEGGDSDSSRMGEKRLTQQSVRYEVEQRVKEKTYHIKKLLNVDPQLKQYKPFLEMITLNNFIDVPVIVGTKAYNIDPFVFLFLFTIAISSKGNMSMCDYSDIQKMFQVIKNMKSNDINIVLNNLIDYPSRDIFDKISDWIDEHPSVRGSIRGPVLSWTNTPASWVVQKSRNIKSRFGINPSQRYEKKQLNTDTVNYPAVNPEVSDIILNVTQNKVQQASIFFKLCMDPESMQRQFGYDTSRGQLETTFSRITPKINEVFKDAENYFSTNLWPNYIQNTLSSFFYAILPNGSGVNVSDLIAAIQSGDNNMNIKPMLDPIMDFLKDDFKNSLNVQLQQQGPEKADETLEQIKNFCRNYFSSSSTFLDHLESLRYQRITGPTFTADDFLRYEQNFENILNKVSNYTLSLDTTLREIFGNQFANNVIINKTSNIINESLNSVIGYLQTLNGWPHSTSFHVTIMQNSGGANVANELNSYAANTRKQLIFYIRFMILYLIQYILCRYVKETKVAVETTKHDVLDQNNYTIVTSIENLFIVANAFAAKSYKDLANKSRREEDGKSNVGQLMRDLGTNYIQGVVKYMHQQLDIPNLIVIDEKKGDAYVRLMYQSKVNKIKLNTMKTFVESSLSNN